MALSEQIKKGGRYTKKEQEERRLQVYHLHFEQEKPAVKIAEMLIDLDDHKTLFGRDNRS